MDKTGQYRQRETNGEIAGEVKNYDGQNPQIEAQSA
jgi:hypothetical protein